MHFNLNHTSTTPRPHLNHSSTTPQPYLHHAAAAAAAAAAATANTASAKTRNPTSFKNPTQLAKPANCFCHRGLGGRKRIKFPGLFSAPTALRRGSKTNFFLWLVFDPHSGCDKNNLHFCTALSRSLSPPRATRLVFSPHCTAEDVENEF